MLKKRCYIIVLLTMSFIWSESCVVKEKTTILNDFPFEIKEAFYQQNIPGGKSQKNYYEFNTTILNVNSNILFDSVFFNGEKLRLLRWNGNDKTILTAKFKVSVLTPHVFLNKEIKENQAVIIGYKSHKKQYFLIDSIIQKADIYLP